jgi:hypothetical protein
MEDRYSTIRLRVSTKSRLEDLGRKSESFDALLRRLLDHVERCKLFSADGRKKGDRD